MKKDMVLCKDCKFNNTNSFRQLFERPILWECKKSVIPGKVSLLSGQKSKDSFEYCSIMRSPGYACGPNGELWQPKHSKKFLLAVLKRI